MNNTRADVDLLRLVFYLLKLVTFVFIQIKQFIRAIWQKNQWF